MNYQKACKILEVQPPITEKELRKQYHRNALRFHPDKTREKSSEKFREVQEAYEYLKKCDTDTYTNTNASNASYVEWYKIYLSSLFSDEILESDIVNNIVQKISKLCVNKSLDYVKTMSTENIILLYQTIHEFKNEIMENAPQHINIIDKIETILREKLENNNTYVINTSLDDLFQHNVYKLQYKDTEFLIPLWHNELYYTYNNEEIIVKCIPELPEHISIDENNDIHVSVRVSLLTLFNKSDKFLSISFGKEIVQIPVEHLYIRRNQIYTIKNKGIARIDTDDTYSIKNISDIHVHIELIDKQ